MKSHDDQIFYILATHKTIQAKKMEYEHTKLYKVRAILNIIQIIDFFGADPLKLTQLKLKWF